ncbi:hypothetical protein INP83_12735 [Mucilaginibacter sp. 21P]|uniref:hypothetical protein n=1 Tax=Mucilaginibacter sp. 21P TaxID=2778902 RepID=UPI001C58A727|nr:hypothetical protein [Mucilaginibacter sp. 21P]QXV63965.1 hypothetical protein INP83_12735 [Mucilaginibacter sp. 21P]
MKNDLNPTLLKFEQFIGTWEMEISNASFLPDAEETIKASASFEWFEEGEFLIFRQGKKNSGTPWAIWFIGQDKDAENYTVLYMDDQRSSRVYEMRFDNNIWKLWRNGPQFMQRFTGEVNEDRDLISGNWEKSVDGKNWEHDFHLTYKKAIHQL